MNQIMAPLIIAITGLPALAIALWSGRDGSAQGRGAGVRWALIALCMFIGAICLYWAGADRPRVYMVVIAMVIAVNALGISLVMHLRRGGDGARRQ